MDFSKNNAFLSKNVDFSKKMGFLKKVHGQKYHESNDGIAVFFLNFFDIFDIKLFHPIRNGSDMDK